MYLVVTGNEYGMCLDAHEEVKFIDDFSVADAIYEKHIEDGEAVVMYEVTATGLNPIKSDYRSLD